MAKQTIPSATIEDIVDRLDTLITVMMPSSTDGGNSATGLAEKILRLCDYDHETDEIRKSVGKSSNHVNKELTLLRKKGLVKTVRRGKRQVHVRLRG